MTTEDIYLAGRQAERTDIRAEWNKVLPFILSARAKISDLEKSGIEPDSTMAQILFDELDLIVRKLAKFEATAFKGV